MAKGGRQLLSTEFTLDHKADTEYRAPLSTLTDHSDTASRLPAANQEPNHRALAVPAVITPRQAGRRRWLRVALALALIVLSAAAGGYWWKQNQARLPAGIAWGNGRIEADEIDISTKFAGRIADLRTKATWSKPARWSRPWTPATSRPR